MPGESQQASADYETLAQITVLVPPRFGGYVPARHPALRYGLMLNDRGYFWEAQEILEAVWAAAPQGGRERILLRACILIATANLRLRMQKPHVAARLLGEALGELEALGMRNAGADGFADWFPVAALAALIKAKLERPSSPRPIGRHSRPLSEHETKCMFRRFRLDFPKTCIIVHLTNQANPEKTTEGGSWPVKIASSQAARNTSIFKPIRSATGTGSWASKAMSRRSPWTSTRTRGLFEGYQLKLNSYDLGVDIELADAVQRLRFEHPEVKAVVVRSGKNRVFCAGANIRMLAGATHAHKVNFCKFTNETRNGLEDLSENSGQRFITVVNGTAAGGGYELALATDHIMLADDGAAAVSLPEVPLLAVLPGTGGLTRVVDKRKVRRDHADFFCTIEEGIKGKRAVAWRLVDEIVPNSKLEGKVADRAKEFAAASKRNGSGPGITLAPLNRTIDDSGIRYGFVNVDIDRAARIATISIKAPEAAPPADIDGLIAQGASFWPLQVARELDDAILHLRINELEIAMLLFKSHGDAANVVAWTPSSKPTRRTGWSTRSGTTGSGC